MKSSKPPCNTSPVTSKIAETLLASLALLHEAALETLWPTRCVICDMPGTLLCHRCRVNLPYLDQLKACPICGAANGIHICTECNRFILDWKQFDSFPLEGCVSTTMLTSRTRRMVTCYKDRGEQRLASILASFMADVLPCSWKQEAAIVAVPTRKAAKRERGFDHMQLLAQQLEIQTQIPLVHALSVQTRKDQRLLGGKDRLQNMTGSFTLRPNAQTELLPYRHILLIDDVMTTGATLFAAANTLRQVTKVPIYGLTFSRA